MNLTQDFFPGILVGVLLSGFLTSFFARIAIRITQHFAIIDFPGSLPHKKHETPTPLAGGLAITFTFLVLVLVQRQIFSAHVIAIISATFLIFIFGFLDDILGLRAWWKIAGQLLASAVLILSGIQVEFISWTGPLADNSLNVLITVLWLLGITNAFNLVDSADGLSLSLASVSCTLFMFAAIVSTQYDLVFAAAMLLGTVLALLYYNVRPASLFLGDSGAQSIGFFLAALGILYNPAIQPQESSWFVPITIVSVPIFDVALVILSRMRHGKPIFMADLGHSYHVLVAKGLSHQRAVLLMNIGGLVVGLTGLFALYQDPVTANFIFAAVIVSGLFLVFYLSR